MQQSTTVPVTVLYTLTGGRKTFISGATKRSFDNRLVPHFNTGIEKAKPFVNEKEKTSFLAQMINTSRGAIYEQSHTIPAADLEPVKLPA